MKLREPGVQPSFLKFSFEGVTVNLRQRGKVTISLRWQVYISVHLHLFSLSPYHTMTKLSLILVLLLSALVLSVKAGCTVNGVPGICISTSSCASSGGTSTPGFCPGPTDIQCCTNVPTCKVGSASGQCISTSACASIGGHSTPGLCPGPADIQVCDYGSFCQSKERREILYLLS